MVYIPSKHRTDPTSRWPNSRNLLTTSPSFPEQKPSAPNMDFRAGSFPPVTSVNSLNTILKHPLTSGIFHYQHYHIFFLSRKKMPSVVNAKQLEDRVQHEVCGPQAKRRVSFLSSEGLVIEVAVCELEAIAHV